MLIETDTSGADAKEEVPLKPEQKGFVVGKAGATISRLQAESGARLRIDPNTHVLTILGSKGQVRARGAAAAQHAHAPRATRTRSPCGFPPLVRACACAHGQVGKAKKMVDDVLIEQASSFADGGGAWSAAGGPTQDISLKPEQCAPVIGCSAGLRTKLLWCAGFRFPFPEEKVRRARKKANRPLGALSGNDFVVQAFVSISASDSRTPALERCRRAGLSSRPWPHWQVRRQYNHAPAEGERRAAEPGARDPRPHALRQSRAGTPPPCAHTNNADFGRWLHSSRQWMR